MRAIQPINKWFLGSLLLGFAIAFSIQNTILTDLHPRIFLFIVNSSMFLQSAIQFWPIITPHYFLIQASLFLIAFGSIISFQPQHKKPILLIYSIIAGMTLNPLFFIGILAYTALIYLGTKRAPSRSVGFYGGIGILTVATAVLWGLVFIQESWDLWRIFFVHTVGLRSLLFLYEFKYQKLEMSVTEYFIYMVFPVHFMIMPSWIVMPFPSEFKTIEPNSDHYPALIKASAKRIFKGIGFLLLMVVFLISIEHGLNKFLFAFPVPFSYWEVFPVDLTNLIARFSLFFVKILYMFFVADVLLGCYGMLGYQIPAVFEKPFLAQSIFEFWDRFLIHTKNAIVKMVFWPMIFFLRKYIKNRHVVLALTLGIGFAIWVFIVHLIWVFPLTTIKMDMPIMWKWYIQLMGLFFVYYIMARYLPSPIKNLSRFKLIRWLKAAILTFLVGIIY